MHRFAYLAIFAVAAAGCGNPTTNPGPDGGAADMATPPDMVMGGPDMAKPANTGKLIFKGKAVTMYGVTSDDNAVFYDMNGNLSAVPLAGGMPPSIIGDNMTAFFGAGGSIRGNTVIGWANFDNTSSIGDLTVWTMATGAQTIATNTVATNTAVSDDGKYILWVGNAAGDGLSGDMIVSQTDGKMQTTLFQAIATDGMNCFPVVGWVGGEFVASHCDKGTTTAKIDLVKPDGTVTNLVPTAGNVWFADKGGKSVAFTDGMGNLSVIPITGGQPKTVDSKFQDGFFTPDGSQVVYITTEQNLRVTTPGMTPKDLAMGVKDFASNLSNDGKYVVFYKMGQFPSDLYVQPLAGGAPVTLTASMNGAIFGDAFTTDSSLAIYYTPTATVTIAAGSGLIGPTTTQPVAGGMPIVHGMKVWNSYATSKPKGIILNDNWKTGMVSGRADIRVVADASTADPATLIATQAEADFFLNPAKTKVAYAWLASAGMEGVYAADLP